MNLLLTTILLLGLLLLSPYTTTTAIAQELEQQEEGQPIIQQPEELGAIIGEQLQPEIQPPPQPTYPCDQLDRYLKENYPNFFLLLRLINIDTLPDPSPPGPVLNTTAFGDNPITILAPKQATAEFLLQSDINVQRLIRDPASAILLAPTLGNHFLHGYFPTANDLPTHPASACGPDVCSPLTVIAFRDQTAVFNDEDQVQLVTPDVANCPGQWVVHEVDGILLSPTVDQEGAREVARTLTYGLGGEFDTFDLV